MNFLKFLPGRTKKASSKQAISKKASAKKTSSESDHLEFDLLYQLTHLSAIAVSGIPRVELFYRASQLPCSTAKYFREIDRMARTMNYEYAEACRIVGESAKQREVRSLLLRLSSALASGEAEVDFLSQEAQIQAEVYGNDYERKLETLRKWTDSYIALMVSVALIIVVAAISMVIYSVGTGFVTGMVAVMVLVSALGCYVLYRTAPQEAKVLIGPQGAESQRLPRRMFVTLMPAAFVTSAVLFVFGISFGWIAVVMGVFFMPIGVVSWWFDRSVDMKDNDISAFLRVLGATSSAIGTTPVEALGRMDLRSHNSLAPAAERLRRMLRSRIAPELCWERFVSETGSELIHRGVEIFTAGTSYGGDPGEVGARAAVLTMKVNFLRAKRALVSSTFGWLSLAMHITIVFLMVFIIEIVDGFRYMVQDASLTNVAEGGGIAVDAALSFNFENIVFLRQLILPVVIILSLINALAPKVTEGGYGHKLFLYLGLTLIATGGSMEGAPWLAGKIFNLGGGV